MRVLICPDTFTGTMSARDAAEAMRAGWLRAAADRGVVCSVDLQPMSDGGPGFADIVSAGLVERGAVPARSIELEVSGPGRRAVSVRIPVVPRASAGDLAILESAACIGLDLLGPDERHPERTSSVGLGEALGALARQRTRQRTGQGTGRGISGVIVGLGGSGTVDGGAGLLAAIGGRAVDASGGAIDLRRGGSVLAGVDRLDLAEARSLMDGLELTAACDVDIPLKGPSGAARGFAPQKGADGPAVARLEAALAAWGRAGSHAGSHAGRRAGATTDAETPGAGAAGGVGFALALLGARLLPGSEVVAEAVDLAARIARADVVITGEGCLDWQSRRGKVVSAVAERALASGTPVVVVAGRIDLGRREIAAMGITGAHALADGPRAVPGTAADLADLTARVATRFLPSRNFAPPGA